MSAPTAPDAATDRFHEDDLASLLERAGLVACTLFSAELRKRRVPAVTWRVLSVLWDGDGLSIGELAERTLVKQPTITRAVDRMSDQGLVRRRPSARDYRQILVFMTDRGRAEAAGLVSRATELERHALADLNDSDVARLKAMVRALIGQLRSRAPRPAPTPRRAAARGPIAAA